LPELDPAIVGIGVEVEEQRGPGRCRGVHARHATHDRHCESAPSMRTSMDR
jgi:hypothetical protein